MDAPTVVRRPGMGLDTKLLLVLLSVFVAPILVVGALVLHRAHEAAITTTCRAQLKQLGLASQAYATDHDGQLPAHLGDLYPEYVKDLSLLVCPGSDDSAGEANAIDAWSSYKIVYPGKRVDDPNLVVVEDKSEHWHGPGGKNQLFADGHVESAVRRHRRLQGPLQ